MFKKLTGVFVGMVLLLCVMHGQDQTLRHWTEVREMSASQTNKQLPVSIDGTVIFADPTYPFFVLGDGIDGIPVHVLGDFPNLNVGDRVHVKGTTLHLGSIEPLDSTAPLLHTPGIRMVDWEKLEHDDSDQTAFIPLPAFHVEDPFFRRVEVEGLVTSIHESDGEWLLGFLREASEYYILRIPDKAWKELASHQLIGHWVKAVGVTLPPDESVAKFSRRSSFVISSGKDLSSVQNLVVGPVSTAQTLLENSDLNRSKPIMMEGVLARKDPMLWVLNTGGESIALTWAESSRFSGEKVRCVGYPVKRGDGFALTPSLVFIPSSLLDPEFAANPENPSWQFRPETFVEKLHSIAEILSLDDEQAQKGAAVEFEATVTYHHPPRYVFFVQDESQAIYVNTANPYPEWVPNGTKVRIKGFTNKGFLQHIVVNAEFEVLDKTDLPPPVLSDYEGLLDGEFDCRFVEITGQVREVNRVENSLELKMQTKNNSFTVFMRDFPLSNNPTSWVDSILRVTGVSGFEYENDKPVGVIVFLQDDTQIQVIRPRSYGDLPPITTSIDYTILAEQSREDISRVQLIGFLTGTVDSKKFTFQTKEQGFLIDPHTLDTNLTIGTFVKVIGWPRADKNGVIVDDAVITPSEPNSRLMVIEKETAPLLNRDFLYRLVSRQGYLIDVNSDSNRLNFIIESSNERFATTLDVSEIPELSASSFKRGSLLNVRGVLSSIPEDTSLGEVPVLILRDKHDIKILAPPSLWTPRRILFAMGITGLAGASAVLWGVLLRRKVQQQTGYIRQMMIKDRQSEEKYHNLFESAMDLIFITDTEGRFVALNESCLKFIGTELKSIQGESFLHWIASTDEEKAKRAFGLDGRSGFHDSIEGDVIEVAMRRSDGEYTHVELSVRGLALQEGVFGYQAIARNIETRKQSEKELIQSRDTHREAHEAKSDFLTMMSHDLRTPMNGVLGMTELLLQSNLDQEQKDQVQTISAASGGVLKLMLDMLEISRLETSQLTFAEEAVDLVAMVDEVVRTLVAESELKHLDMVVICHPTLQRHVRTDGARLKQVLLNIVSNAIRFTDKGGVVVRLFEKGQLDGKNVFRFEIEDSGISLQKGNRENLFEVLTKTDPDQPRRFGGAGLGLTLSKRIVKAMGGDIGADQVLNKGVLLWFELPFEKSFSLQDTPEPGIKSTKQPGNMLLITDSRFIKEYFIEHAKAIQLSIEILSLADFKEQMMSGKPWNGIPFQTLLVDCRHMLFDQLVSLIDQADSFWKTGFRWVVVDTLHLMNSAWASLPINAEPLRLAHPLTEDSFERFCHFLSESDGVGNVSDIESNTSSELESSKLILSESPLRVLVAEDDPINQKLIRMYLEKTGCITKVVPEGEQAIERLESEPYDVVLMDCNMAGLDGIEATRRIRSNKKFDDLVIIATTANALKGHREQCFEAGMNDFLVKPLNLGLLTMKLARVASIRREQGNKN